MPIGARFGSRVGAVIGARIGTAAGVIPGNTTCTVALTDSADPVITGGDAFSYAAVVQNTGASLALSLSLVITLDASLTYVSASGSGWSISRVGQVVTCTLASLGAGATAGTVTVNVTTGSSALTASSSAALSGSNFTTANNTQTTTVNLVTKDATAGLYLPQSSTEWTNFIARKGLSISVPNSSWNMGAMASGNATDQIGALTLTAAVTPGYQQTITGFAQKGVTIPTGTSTRFAAAAGVGPNPSTTSQFWLWAGSLDTAPAGARDWAGISNGSTPYQCIVNATPRIGNTVAATTVTGTLNPIGSGLFAYNYDRTGSRANVYTQQEKVVGTYNSDVVDGLKGFGANGGTAMACSAAQGYMWQGTPGEMSDANIKALLQAMGATIPWT